MAVGRTQRMEEMRMLNLLEEGFNLGLGVASVAYNKVDDLVKATLDKVGVKGEEGGNLKERLVNEGKAARERIAEATKEKSAKLADFMPLSAKLDAILSKLEKLEAEVAELKANK